MKYIKIEQNQSIVPGNFVHFHKTLQISGKFIKLREILKFFRWILQKSERFVLTFDEITLFENIRLECKRITAYLASNEQNSDEPVTPRLS